MKTKNKTLNKTWSVQKKAVVGASSLVVFGAIIFQIAFNVQVYQLASYAASDHMADLLISAIEGLKKPVPVDAETGKMYIADAKLLWPAESSLFGQVIYSYDSEWVDETGMQFSTTAIQNVASSKLRSMQGNDGDNIEAVFEQLPNLQACAGRGVQVYYQKQKLDSPEYEYHGSVSLKDGRELHFYTESTCKEDQTVLLDYLKKAESY